MNIDTHMYVRRELMKKISRCSNPIKMHSLKKELVQTGLQLADTIKKEYNVQ